MESTELRAWLRLATAPGLGGGAARRLLQSFGSAEAIFQAPLAQLKQVISPPAATALLEAAVSADALADATWSWLHTPASAEIQGTLGGDSFRAVLTLADPLYPPSLLRTDDPPLLLHVHARPGFWEAGQGFLQEQPAAIAVVGSRNASTQGALHAKQFSKALSESGWTVVSGLALGIDAAAHEGAMDASEGGAGTIAVIGTGIDRIYPKGNAQLARRIVQRGAIVSEFVMGSPPLAHHFPRRNRIIAGLSLGTLVVEAAPQSGSLITARLAVEQGKEVFAIPGSIHSTHSKGCHALIKQGAALVESVQDILDAPGFGVRSRNAPVFIASNLENEGASEQNHSKNGSCDPPWLARMGFDPVDLDELLARSGEATAKLQADLLELELTGRVQRLPGNRFQQIGSA